MAALSWYLKAIFLIIIWGQTLFHNQPEYAAICIIKMLHLVLTAWAKEKYYLQ